MSKARNVEFCSLVVDVKD